MTSINKDLRSLSRYIEGYIGKKMKSSFITTRFNIDKTNIIISTKNKCTFKLILRVIEEFLNKIPEQRKSPLQDILKGNYYECLLTISEAEQLMTALRMGGYYNE